MLRHALSVVEFVEGESRRNVLESDVNRTLAEFLIATGPSCCEEAGPLIHCLHELATTGHSRFYQSSSL